ncbi:hypothetical protein AB0J47_18130 [Nocardia sp. NPDC049737]|uniref:hypothetical protein n=1 Tax=Nocardia sp. NPDC049737 TaxID=3154358 RepID=UPI0034300CCB
MREPTPEVEYLPSWKLRLLERIQDSAADHARMLRQGYPTYEPHYGSGEIPLQNWRTHLRALEADREEIATHALAVGIPSSAIDRAYAVGQRGLRWADSVWSPLKPRGEDAVRAHMVEGVAADIWQLEHMAAIAVERRFGRPPSRIQHSPDATEVAQYGRNMAALWNRANNVAHAIELTAQERAELWGRDEAGWLRLTAVTVRCYNDADLMERWRAYAWPGIEHEARRSIDTLPVGQVAGDEQGAAPPTPHVLIDRATEALTVTTPAEEAARADIGDAVDAALPPDPVAAWDDETGIEPDARPPEPGSSPGHEL